MASVATATVGPPRYSQALLLTVTGTHLDQPITVSSGGCSNITRSTAAPNISSSTTAYYTCTASAVGAHQFVLTRSADGASLGTAAYNVPVPQVTMTVSNGAAVNGNFVITLAPQQAPITVNNFLAYVNAGFYDGTVFHRYVPGFVLQGGGFSSPLAPAATVPALKPTQPRIALEDNTGLTNTLYTVAMARLSTPVDSATSQFFINLRDNTALRDGAGRGYATFGSVTTGTNMVVAITGAPCVRYPALLENPGVAWDGTCLPSPNVVITNAAQTQ